MMNSFPGECPEAEQQRECPAARLPGGGNGRIPESQNGLWVHWRYGRLAK